MTVGGAGNREEMKGARDQIRGEQGKSSKIRREKGDRTPPLQKLINGPLFNPPLHQQLPINKL